MPVTPEVYRRVLGHLAGGVAVVTSIDEAGSACGLTATAICSVSLSPPLVLVCLDRESSTHRAIRASGRYALNFLASSARSLSERFASSDADKFTGVRWAAGATGCPVLVDAMASCECVLVRSVEAGDHTVFIGRVERAAAPSRAGQTPLVHYLGRYAAAVLASGEGESADVAGHGQGPGKRPSAPGPGRGDGAEETGP